MGSGDRTWVLHRKRWGRAEIPFSTKRLTLNLSESGCEPCAMEEEGAAGGLQVYNRCRLAF